MFKKKVKETNKQQHRKDYSFPYLIGGVIAIAGGLFFAYLYSTTMVMMLAFPSIVLLGIGALLIYFFRKKKEEVSSPIVTGTPIPTKQVNSMNIYPADLKGDRFGVMFEDTAKPEGQPRVCINDGKPYFVHIWNNETRTLMPFALPDQQYYDPRVFAERVLELPAHRKIFQRKQSFLHKISPFILILVIFALWIVIITTTGQKAP